MGNDIIHITVKKNIYCKFQRKSFPALFQMQRLVSKFTKVQRYKKHIIFKITMKYQLFLAKRSWSKKKISLYFVFAWKSSVRKSNTLLSEKKSMTRSFCECSLVQKNGGGQWTTHHLLRMAKYRTLTQRETLCSEGR